VADNESEIFDLFLFKFTFLWSKVEIMFFKAFEDFVDNFPMGDQVVTPDKDVIQIYSHFAFSDEVGEDAVHEGLEGCRRVGETKEHYFWFEQSLISYNSLSEYEVESLFCRMVF
jgi:hypothetical protein